MDSAAIFILPVTIHDLALLHDSFGGCIKALFACIHLYNNRYIW